MPTLDELREQAAAAAAALAEAEAAANAPPPLKKAAAKAAYEAAVANLAVVEGPFWELEHAAIDLNAARNLAATAPDTVKEAAEAAIPPAEARLKAAIAAHAAAGFTAKDIDAAAQAVIDARAALENAV